MARRGPHPKYEQVRAALVADPNRPNPDIARELDVRDGYVALIRYKLNHPDGGPARARPPRAGSESALVQDLLTRIRSGELPDRRDRMKALATIMALGTDQAKTTAIRLMEDIELNEAANIGPPPPTEEAEMVNLLYRIFRSAGRAIATKAWKLAFGGEHGPPKQTQTDESPTREGPPPGDRDLGGRQPGLGGLPPGGDEGQPSDEYNGGVPIEENEEGSYTSNRLDSEREHSSLALHDPSQDDSPNSPDGLHPHNGTPEGTSQ